MINLSRDIQSLSTFKRNTNELIIQMKETGNPVVLTINGKAELVVQDAEFYQKLLNSIEYLESIIAVFSRVRGNKILERLTVKDSNTPHSCDYHYIGIQKGSEDIANGDTQPLDQFMEEMQQKYGI